MLDNPGGFGVAYNKIIFEDYMEIGHLEASIILLRKKRVIILCNMFTILTLNDFNYNNCKINIPFEKNIKLLNIKYQ